VSPPERARPRSALLSRYEDSAAYRELTQAGLQVWQALSQRLGLADGSVEATILFTELCDFSSWVLEAGDELALELLREVAAVVDPIVTAHGGRVVKHLGHGHMAVFASAADGVEAALEILGQVAGVQVRGHHPRLRAGLHCGQPQRMAGDFLGTDVNVAARVSEAAREGEVLVSGAVLEALEDGEREGLEIRRRRGFRAKGAPRGLEVFSVSRG